MKNKEQRVQITMKKNKMLLKLKVEINHLGILLKCTL